MALAQKLLRPRLVGAVGVAVEEHDRGGFDAELFELVAQRGEARLVERRDHLAVGAHALLDLEAQRALDQRLVLLEIEIVGVGPVDAADLVDVAEAFGRHQRGLRAGALQHGVDGDRRAVQEQARRRVVAAGLLDAARDAVDQPVRRRQRLAEGQPPGLVVEHRDVGEGAADVGGEPDVGAVAAAGTFANCHLGDACLLTSSLRLARSASSARFRPGKSPRAAPASSAFRSKASCTARFFDRQACPGCGRFRVEPRDDLLRRALRPLQREPGAGGEIVAAP